ncbi:MAG TPA: ATP-binding cassette domain-containing protein [Spirochaetia bacterium]|nr:ATP-binding cassette domain-containing protein [Spirochaetia bacterium]
MAIECINLTKRYGSVVAVDNLSVSFDEHKLSILIGPSGCGKTTVLTMLNRLTPISDGDIRFDGVSIKDIDPIELRRSIGYVIQEIGLFPHMTVYENIATVPRLLKWPEAKIRKRADELLDLVNLAPDQFRDKFPTQVSGGQRQRIGVARGLAADPKILLMDEPFGAIDPINRERLQDSFLEIQRHIQKTIVFVTHDIREAVKLGDKIAILRMGKLIQYDETLMVINQPENEFVENLLGSDRALKGLELIRVRDSLDSNFFSLPAGEAMPIKTALDKLHAEHRSFAFLIGSNGKLAGYVLTRDLERAPDGRSIDDHAKEVESILPYGTLMEAITLMVTTGLTAVPVVDDRDILQGVIRFRDVFDKVAELAGTSGD